MNVMASRRRLVFSGLLVALALVTGLAAALWLDGQYGQRYGDPLDVARGKWLAEYAELRTYMEWYYPNLEWTAKTGSLDLKTLHSATTRRVETSRTHAEAQRAMSDFVDAFQDGHLGLREGKKPGHSDQRAPTDVLSRHTRSEDACEALGYTKKSADDRPFEFAAFAPVTRFDDDNPFDGKVLEIAGWRVGVVRIPSLNEYAYGPTCRSESRRAALTMETSCEGRCRYDFRIAVRNRLIRSFETRLWQLVHRHVSVVVLDLSGNHGGQPWSEPLMTVLTGRSLPTPLVSFMRVPETAGLLGLTLRRLDRSLAMCRPPESRRVVVEQEYRRFETARIEEL